MLLFVWYRLENARKWLPPSNYNYHQLDCYKKDLAWRLHLEMWRWCRMLKCSRNYVGKMSQRFDPFYFWPMYDILLQIWGNSIEYKLSIFNVSTKTEMPKWYRSTNNQDFEYFSNIDCISYFTWIETSILTYNCSMLNRLRFYINMMRSVMETGLLSLCN